MLDFFNNLFLGIGIALIAYACSLALILKNSALEDLKKQMISYGYSKSMYKVAKRISELVSKFLF